ncbi:hypothetical protein HYS50_02890 [Candidatus Woesearchaeota archaeon]|nr:hypothetical protein [Candidatus Woesearchaeota archaeon]
MHKLTQRYLWLLLFAVIILIFLTAFGYYMLHPVTQQVIPVDITIGDYTGINLDDDAIHFGTLKPGSLAQRPVRLRADAYDVEITLLVEGIPFVFPEQEKIVLRKGEQETIRLFAVTDLLTPRKTYEGRLIILSKAL